MCFFLFSSIFLLFEWVEFIKKLKINQRHTGRWLGSRVSNRRERSDWKHPATRLMSKTRSNQDTSSWGVTLTPESLVCLWRCPRQHQTGKFVFLGEPHVHQSCQEQSWSNNTRQTEQHWICGQKRPEATGRSVCTQSNWLCTKRSFCAPLPVERRKTENCLKYNRTWSSLNYGLVWVTVTTVFNRIKT